MRFNVSHQKHVGTVFAALLLATTALAGCGQGGTEAGEPTLSQSPTSNSPSTSSPEPTKPTTSAESTTTTTNTTGSAPPARTGLCTSGDLELSFGPGNAAAGTLYQVLRFVNASDRECVIQGFPGISYVAGDDGHQVGPAAYREGTKGAPVTLTPGDVAHTVIGFVQVRNYDTAVCKPTPVRGLRVYPPQETESMFLPMAGREGCASNDIPGHQLKVKTIKPGRGGT